MRSGQGRVTLIPHGCKETRVEDVDDPRSFTVLGHNGVISDARAPAGIAIRYWEKRRSCKALRSSNACQAQKLQCSRAQHHEASLNRGRPCNLRHSPSEKR